MEENEALDRSKTNKPEKSIEGENAEVITKHVKLFQNSSYIQIKFTTKKINLSKRLRGPELSGDLEAL